MRIIFFSGEVEGRGITAVAVVSPFSFALLEFTHFQSHRETRERERRGVRARRGVGEEETHGFHVRSFLHLDLDIN